MKNLYIECNMGAAGDMLTAALLELLPDPDAFVKKLNGLGIPGVVYTAVPATKCGISGTHMEVTVNGITEADYYHNHEHQAEPSGHEHGHEHEHIFSHEHHASDHDHHEDHTHEIHGHGHEAGEAAPSHAHAAMDDIVRTVSHLGLPANVTADILAVYSLIAEAESRAHDMPVSDIHFHEVGTMDAIADVTAVCMLINELAPDSITVSPVNTGSGHVHCAHGILPIPAPAVAYLLEGVPSYSDGTQGELCTPTGAALLKHFAGSFGDRPAMSIRKTGYGMGMRDFPQANCVRAYMGDMLKVPASTGNTDEICELRCNIDDMTPEALGFALDILLENGALDVFTIPVYMKKSRPGTLLTCLCRESDREKILALLFRHTTTIGVRETVCNRYVLDRSSYTVVTGHGNVRIKKSSGYGVVREKAEFDDLSAIAKNSGMTLDEISRIVALKAGLNKTDITD